MPARFVYVTCKDREQARAIGKTVVRERLAACANLFDGMESIYWWEGEVEVASECVLILKTTELLVERLVDAVKAAHSYDVPCVVALPIVAGNQDYLDWLCRETGGGTQS